MRSNRVGSQTTDWLYVCLSLLTAGISAFPATAWAAAPLQSLETVALSGDSVPGLAGMRFPSHFHPTTFFEPRINHAGHVLFAGGLPVSNGFAIIAGPPESLRLVTATDKPAPDTEVGTVFDAFYDAPLAFNDLDEVAFVARVRSIAENYSGIWTESAGGTIRKAARLGDQAPDTAIGVRFSDFEGPILSNNGRMMFRAEIDATPGPGLQTTGIGYWSETADHTLHLLVHSGLPAPGIPNGTISDAFVTLTHDGEFYVHGTAVIQNTPFSTTNVPVVWRGDSYASLTKVFDGRTSPPNIPGFVRFAFNFSPQANENGHIASMGTLEFREGDQLLRHKGLFVIQPDGAIRSVAVENGQPPDTPTGSFYSSDIFHFEINDAGHTAFKGSIALPGAPFQDRTIFAEGSDGQLRLVARQTAHAPGTPTGVFFGVPVWTTQVQDTFEPPAYNNVGQVAFLAGLNGPGITDQNNIGLWATDRHGALILIAREGDPLQVAPGNFRTIAELIFVGGGGDGLNRLTGLNDSGLVTFSARFTDGTSGLFVSHLVAIPEPNSGVLLLVAILAFNVRYRRVPWR